MMHLPMGWVSRTYGVRWERLAEVEALDLAILRGQKPDEAAQGRSQRGAELTELAERLARDGVALIPVHGLLWKGAPWWISATDPGAIERAVLAALRSSDIHRTVLHVRSPGGVIDGHGRAADAIHRHSLEKPITVVIEDLGASCAAWLGLAPRSRGGMGRVILDPYAELGSIGMYSVLLDTSKLDAERGIRRIVRSTGKYKGLAEHSDVPPELLEEVDRLHGVHFGAMVAHIARGRNLPEERIRELGDGRLYVGAAAVELGLADDLGTLDDVLGESSDSTSAAVRAERARRARSTHEKGDTDMPLDDTKDKTGAFSTSTSGTSAATTTTANTATPTDLNQDLAVLRALARDGSHGDLDERLARVVSTLESQADRQARRDASLARGEAAALAEGAITKLGDAFTPALRFRGAAALLQDLASEHRAVELGASDGQRLLVADASGVERQATRFEIFRDVLAEASATNALLGDARRALTGEEIAGADREPEKPETSDTKARADLLATGWTSEGIDEVLGAEPDLDAAGLLARMRATSFTSIAHDPED